MKNLFLLFAFSLMINTCIGQGNILLIADLDCLVVIDGEKEEELLKGTPKKISLAFGEHYIQAKGDGSEITKMVEVNSEKQKIVKLNFSEQSKEITDVKATAGIDPILVSQLELSLYGGVNSLVDDPNYGFDDSELFYAFEEGDEVIVNADLNNKNGKFYIEVYSYPDQNSIYSKSKLKELKNHRISIKKRGIYVIQIGTTAVFDKRVNLRVERIPLKKETVAFNTKVLKKYKFETIEVDRTFSYLNSTSNETFKGGSNEVVIPVNIPKGAIEWYYSFTASRDKHAVKDNMEKVSLLGQLTEVVNGLNPTTSVINIGINLLTSPPGADYCDVFLMDYNNRQLFVNDNPMSYVIEGSRKNLKSSTVKVKCCMEQQYYLGIENDDMTNGIHVGVEIVAIKRTVYFEREE